MIPGLPLLVGLVVLFLSAASGRFLIIRIFQPECETAGERILLWFIGCFAALTFIALLGLAAALGNMLLAPWVTS